MGPADARPGYVCRPDCKGRSCNYPECRFNFSRRPIPAKRPEFSAVLGEKSGSVILHCKAIKGAYAYVWQSCKGTLAETEAGWTYADATGKATVTLLDQVPITKYWSRVAAVLAEGTAAYCEPISIVIG